MKKRECLLIKVVCSLSICLILSFFASPVFAAEAARIRVGKLKITPGIGVKGSYTNNVFFDDNNTKKDFIVTVTPSFLFEYLGALGNYLTAGYAIDLVGYTNYSDNSYVGHKPWISLTLRNLGGFYLYVDDYFLYTEDPYGTRDRYNDGKQTERFENAVNVTFGRSFGDRYAAEVFYKHYLVKFDLHNDQWQNRQDHSYGASFFVKVAQRTFLFGQYRQTIADYYKQNDGCKYTTLPPLSQTYYFDSDNSQDYKIDDYFIGARFFPGGKIKGEIKFGWTRKDFDNDHDPFGIPSIHEPYPVLPGDKYEDEETWAAETTVHYMPRKDTTFILSILRSIKGAPDGDASSYIDSMVGLDLIRQFNKATLNLGFAWINMDYLNEDPAAASGDTHDAPKKYFNVYNFKAGVDYQFRPWLTAGLQYEHREKDASHNDYDINQYASDILTVKADFAF